MSILFPAFFLVLAGGLSLGFEVEKCWEADVWMSDLEPCLNPDTPNLAVEAVQMKG